MSKMKIGEVADMTPSDVLRAAADELVRFGWAQNSLGWPDAQKCLIGAVRFADHGDVCRYSQLLDSVTPSLAACAGTPDLANWNDYKGRTADEVIALLLTVADDLESP